MRSDLPGRAVHTLDKTCKRPGKEEQMHISYELRILNFPLFAKNAMAAALLSHKTTYLERFELFTTLFTT
jgi:hypothetical protein